MKVLILSCNTGGGHNSAAKAIKEIFDKKGHTCDITDVLAFGGQKASDLVCDAYIEIVKKTPNLFGKIYKMGNKVGQFNQENGKLAPYNKHLNPIEGNLLVANRTDIKTQ